MIVERARIKGILTIVKNSVKRVITIRVMCKGCIQHNVIHTFSLNEEFKLHICGISNERVYPYKKIECVKFVSRYKIGHQKRLNKDELKKR